MQLNKPAGAPSCWSLQFTDGDQECMQCPYRDSCRPASMARYTQGPTSPMTYLPATQQAIPLPPRPYLGPGAQLPTIAPQAPAQVFRPPAPSPTVVQNYQQWGTPVQYPPQTQPTQFSIPDPRTIHPGVPMMRPGAPVPAYYLCQYPEESVPARIGKNMLLRAAEAIFGELMLFFRHYTWPKR